MIQLSNTDITAGAMFGTRWFYVIAAVADSSRILLMLSVSKLVIRSVIFADYSWVGTAYRQIGHHKYENTSKDDYFPGRSKGLYRLEVHYEEEGR